MKGSTLYATTSMMRESIVYAAASGCTASAPSAWRLRAPPTATTSPSQDPRRGRGRPRAHHHHAWEGSGRKKASSKLRRRRGVQVSNTCPGPATAASACGCRAIDIDHVDVRSCPSEGGSNTSQAHVTTSTA